MAQASEQSLYLSSTDDIMGKEGKGGGSTVSVLPLDADHGEQSVGAAALARARKRRRRRILIIVGAIGTVLAIAGIVLGVLFAKQIIKTGSGSAVSKGATAAGLGAEGGESGAASPSPADTGAGTRTSSSSSASATPKPPVSCSKSDDIPSSAKGSALDVTSWSDMAGFNCTFTSELVGGLPIVGLNSTWDDSAQANPNVPALNKPWGSYAKRPIRGVNLGGWLSLEPFITPSLFEPSGGTSIVDEYSLCKQLGKEAAALLDKHYSTFITEADFKAIADAGLDHIRLPFSYWAVKNYEGDPYPAGLSWRYLLRGIEWARKYGLRIKLDLHGLPGSQNGWNHSGRQGTNGWKKENGGDESMKRSLEIHDALSRFFAQERYANVVAFYGLANEPKDVPQSQLVAWTADAYDVVRRNGVKAPQVFSESMKGLDAWAGQLGGKGDSLVVDVHQYAIFDNNLLRLKHAEKIALMCKEIKKAIEDSVGGGFGPTMVGEWSQADTDCTKYLNGVGNGARWEGKFSGTHTPACPTQDSKCSCDKANADPSTYTSEYKAFLQTFAEAQMDVFEKSWGWFYWTWKSESAHLWSYKAGLDGKFMPAKAHERSWDCSKSIPSFGDLPEYY